MTPPARATNWRKAKRARMSCIFASSHPLRQPRQLAEGVEFLEKKWEVDHYAIAFGGGAPGPSPEVAGKPQGAFADQFGLQLEQLRTSWASVCICEKKISKRDISSRAIWIFPKAGHHAML